MEPQAGRIQPLPGKSALASHLRPLADSTPAPVQVFYNHAGVAPDPLVARDALASASSSASAFAAGPTCSLVLPEAQDVFVHPRRAAGRKRRRLSAGKGAGVEVKDEEGEGADEGVEWDGSVSLMALMRAICFARWAKPCCSGDARLMSSHRARPAPT